MTREKHLCETCSPKTLIGLDVLTPWSCQLCEKEQLSESSLVNVYCLDCAKRLNKCEQCGSLVDDSEEEDEGKSNFDRITMDENSLMKFVMLEVLDLAGPHMDHDTRHFRTGIKFREWLRKEVDKQKGFDDFSVNEQTIFAFQELDVRDMTDEELNYAASTANNIMLDIQKEQRKRE